MSLTAGLRWLGLALVLVAGSLPATAQSANQPSAPVEADEGARRVVLRFLTEADFPPFNFQDDEGQLTGLNVDLARAICLEAGAACDIQVKGWDELVPALTRGEADAIVAGHRVTARMLARVDFTDRYFHTPGRFAGRKAGPALEISPGGLDGKRIGVARGTAHEAYLASFFRLSAVVPFGSPELAREALQDGKVDVLFDDGISLSFWMTGTSGKECCEFKGGPFLEPKYFGDGVAIAIPKGDAQLRQVLNTALRKVRASGRFEEIVLRYFPVRIY